MDKACFIRSAHRAGVLLILAAFALAACAPAKQGEGGFPAEQGSQPPPEGQDPPLAEAPVQGGGENALVAPLWEQARPLDGPHWTAHAMQAMQVKGSALLAGTSDIANFCAAYSGLSQEQKISFWVFFVSAVVKFESGFDPANRYKEKGMGTDPITKLPVYSEGLLQLSYQDVKPYPFCNEFSWEQDKLLAPEDPRKTIFDPARNLTCGIRIMNQIMAKKKLISFDKGQYWSVLMPSHRNSKVKNIMELTRSIAFCRK